MHVYSWSTTVFGDRSKFGLNVSPMTMRQLMHRSSLIPPPTHQALPPTCIWISSLFANCLKWESKRRCEALLISASWKPTTGYSYRIEGTGSTTDQLTCVEYAIHYLWTLSEYSRALLYESHTGYCTHTQPIWHAHLYLMLHSPKFCIKADEDPWIEMFCTQ